MKTRLKSFTALIGAAACALSFTACGSNEIIGKSMVLGEPKTVENV